MHHTGNSSGGIDPGAQEAGYIVSAIMPGTAQILSTIANIFIIILGWWSVLLEVFLRYDFGERYLSWLRLFFAYVVLGWLWFFPTLLVRNLAIQGAPLLNLFGAVFVLLSLWHRLRIWLRYQRRIPWHSRSFGTSRLSALDLPVIGHDDWTLYRWYEPALCLIISFIIGRFDGITGLVIGGGSIALLLKNHMVYYQQRGRILDLIDARLEAIYYNEAATSKPKEDVAGIAVMPVVWPKIPDAPTGIDEIQKTVQEAQKKTPATPAPTTPSAPAAGGGMDFSDTLADVMKPGKDE